jgi:hypothetical protein
MRGGVEKGQNNRQTCPSPPSPLQRPLQRLGDRVLGDCVA